MTFHKEKKITNSLTNFAICYHWSRKFRVFSLLHFEERELTVFMLQTCDSAGRTYEYLSQDTLIGLREAYRRQNVFSKVCFDLGLVIWISSWPTQVNKKYLFIYIGHYVTFKWSPLKAILPSHGPKYEPNIWVHTAVFQVSTLFLPPWVLFIIFF